MSADGHSLPDFDALWDYSQPAKTEQRFRELLPAAESSGNADYHLEMLTQIARTQGLQRRFDEAHATLNRVEAAAGGASDRTRIRYLLERGRVFNSAGRRDQARPLFLEAWDVAQRAHEDALAVDAAHMMGIIEPPEQQIEWNVRAMEFAEASSDPGARMWLGSLLNNLGWTYHDRGDHLHALELFTKAHAFRQTRDDPEATRIAEWCIARALRSLGRTEEALAIQQAQLKQLETEKRTGPYVYEEMGECLYALGRHEEAQPYLARAYEVLRNDPWFVENNPKRLASLKQRSEG